VNANGDLLPNVRKVMGFASEASVAIGLGHTDFEEVLPLCTLANEIGVRTMLDHPLLELNKLLVEEMLQLADLGTFVGAYCQPIIPSLYQPVQDPMETIEVIKRVGPARCVSRSDFDQVLDLDAIDGIRVFVRALLGFGIFVDDAGTMLCDNLSALLGLD
jgi:Family of unknown function (DUF6282)